MPRMLAQNCPLLSTTVFPTARRMYITLVRPMTCGFQPFRHLSLRSGEFCGMKIWSGTCALVSKYAVLVAKSLFHQLCCVGRAGNWLGCGFHGTVETIHHNFDAVTAWSLHAYAYVRTSARCLRAPVESLEQGGPSGHEHHAWRMRFRPLREGSKSTHS